MAALLPECRMIPAGVFLMGSESGQDCERPAHRVRVGEFAMAIYQIRNRDYAPFLESMGRTPPRHWNDPDFNHPDQPVVAVCWFDAVEYCRWLSGMTGASYRLPTEAEWERAARGGREGLDYPWGSGAPETRIEYQRRWGGEVRGPLPVGRGEPNGYGLFDLCENVHEWCADWFEAGYYAVSPARNPQGPESGERRASRGGSWRHHVKVSRCAARSSIPPQLEYADYGFRVARSL
jgi:formylglycine-generating enzyme required for sulfatase activity